MSVIRPVILSGGSGTRLWPVSRQDRPKQFLNLIGTSSLFSEAVERGNRIPNSVHPIIVTGRAHVDLVADELVDPAIVVVEPAPRNTAPAIVAAALVAEPTEILVVLPSDHLIRDSEAFFLAIDSAQRLAGRDAIATFGVVPTRPEAGYGWIRKGLAADGGFQIGEFVEKPSIESATEMLHDGDHLWNSGMFVARAGVIRETAKKLVPDLFDAVAASIPNPSGDRLDLTDTFLDAPSISFDHAIMENLDAGFVVPLDAGWSDIGSWEAIWEVTPKDELGNATEGDVVLVDSGNSLVRSSSRPIAVIGLNDVVVVETDAGILVAARDRVQEVRDVVKQLRPGAVE